MWKLATNATAALLIAAALVVLPHWVQSWIHTVLAYRHYTQPPLVAEVLTSPLGPHLAGPATMALTAASIVIAVVLAWRNRAAAAGSRAFWITLTLLLTITTITVLQGLAVYDHLILLPGILLLVRYRSELANAGPVPGILLIIGALFLFWPWISAFALIMLRPWIAPSIFNSSAVFSLPIRNAASLPFAVLALLAWMWRVTPQSSEAA